MKRYIHELKDWPSFTWDAECLVAKLGRIRHLQGLLMGKMMGLGFKLGQEAMLETLTSDVVRSSEIEGEKLHTDEVRSSVASRLGMSFQGMLKPGRYVDGVVEMMMDATGHYDKPLTEDRLFGWHAALFPTARSGMQKITVGAWRKDETGPMQVVSGPMGKERVHFQAIPSKHLHKQMKMFLDWFNKPAGTDPVIKAAVAHLWFLTIHPFDDGNGRIARALTDMLLARAENSSQRFYSLSAQIMMKRKHYYEILERSQKGSLDITPWMEWFLDCLLGALGSTETTLAMVLRKARFWERHALSVLNERQRKMINRLFDGFEGKLNSSKYAKLSRCSPDTALRDLQDLMEKGIMKKDKSGGRSTHYLLIY